MQSSNSVWTASGGTLPVLRGDAGQLPAPVAAFVAAGVEQMQPRALWIVDGSAREAAELEAQLEAQGVLKRLPPSRPNSALCRTALSDVALVEGRTWTVAADRRQVEGTEAAGASQLAKWMSREQMQEELARRFPGAMRGRTMYVIVFSMGPVGGPASMVGVELTDSAYVVLCKRLTTRVSLDALAWVAGGFVRCVHSVGAPLPLAQATSCWESNAEQTLIVHDPGERTIWSFGSGYGGNALLGKKCLALRMANWAGRSSERPWLAAHMGILGLTRLSDGVKRYFGVAFPAGCGKSNLAMLQPSLPGWKVECVGDDIAWLRWNPKTRRLCALNPESGFFGVATGTNKNTNPVAMRMISANTLFTNVGEAEDGDVVWDGLEEGWETRVKSVTDWRGKRRETYADMRGISHPNARFACPLSQCPIAHPPLEVESFGVPLDAIIFGSRRPTDFPLVYEASPLILGSSPKARHSCSAWARGAYIGASLRSEVAASQEETLAPTPSMEQASTTPRVHTLKQEPFAMRPFIPYNLGHFVRNWLALGEPAGIAEPVVPRVYHVNWFREDDSTGLLLWPGFGENIRVLEWMMRRLDEGPGANGVPSPSGQLTLLGIAPTPASIRLQDLGLNTQLLFDQTYIYLGTDVVDTCAFFKEQGGRDFPVDVALCGFHHFGVRVLESVLRQDWTHLNDSGAPAAHSPSSSHSDTPTSYVLKTATEDDTQPDRQDAQ